MDERAHLARWTGGVGPSALQQMLQRTSSGDVLSFALGVPAVELFPSAAIARALSETVLADARSLQYGPPSGELKQHVVALMRRRGVDCLPEQVFLTTGAQQGLNLLARVLVNAGDEVVAEELIYTGFQQVLETSECRVVTAPTDPRTGMDVDALERRLASGARPAFIYAIPSGHNPLGVDLSPEKRAQLVALARRFRVPIVEDDPYGALSYSGAETHALRALDPEWVYYVGSFSKVLAPALRAGWLVVPTSLVPLLAIAKEASDIDMAPVTQRAIATYLGWGQFEEHTARLVAEYRRRRDALVQALDEHFPKDAKWSIPTSGFFVWVELGDGIDASALLQSAFDDERVAFIPGGAFSICGREAGMHGMRLSFAQNAPERIREGIARLGRAIGRCRQSTTMRARSAARGEAYEQHIPE